MSQITLMMNSFLNPTLQNQLPIPAWLNLDQLITTSRSLFNRLKPKVESLPPQPVTTPDDEFHAVMQQNKRKWIESQMVRYQSIFNRYQQYKESNVRSGAGTRISNKVARDILQNRQTQSVMTSQTGLHNKLSTYRNDSQV